jgi:Phytochelatin synthase
MDVMRRFLITGSIIAAFLAATAFALSPARIPPEKIAASVAQAPALVERAWQLPVAKTFNHQVFAQSNLSRCGPASLANVFRSLSELATTESAVLAGTGRCWTGYCIVGLTLDELADVARARTNRKVTVLRDLSSDEFLDHLRRSNDPGKRYVINFRRKEIFGSGGGHHSPIAGYFENEGLVFVLDVNENFRPWLVERSRLFAAMNTLDGDKKRGLLLIE